jgi:hypothetical protein
MLIRNPQTFRTGATLAVTFIGVLIVIFMPIFGDGRNGLVYSDDLFNKLSKGSSYFIPEVRENVRKFEGQTFSVAIKADKPEFAEKAVSVLLKSNVQVGTEGEVLRMTGDLGRFLGTVIENADAMYHNNGSKVAAAYGMREQEVMETLWAVLNRGIKEFQRERKVEEANILDKVMKRAVEPAYNFYGIEAQSIGDKALTVIALLTFYVIYTMWWGYAIFYMFDGIGLSMKKAKVKKEV